MDVVVNNVYRTFYTSKMRVEALKGVNMDVESGEIAVVYGPSGSGKSVLLNIIAGLEKVDRGTVEIGGVEISSLSWGEMNLFRRRHIAYCMQRNILIPRLTTRINIALPLLLRGVGKTDALEKAGDLAELLGIGYTLDRPAYTLSGGEQRRAVLARTLLIDADLYLLDEPTSSLDEETAGHIRRVLLDTHASRGSTMIVSTHDKGFIEMADKVYKIVDGVMEQVK